MSLQTELGPGPDRFTEPHPARRQPAVPRLASRTRIDRTSEAGDSAEDGRSRVFRLELLSQAEGLWVFRNLRAAPRAFIVGRARRAGLRQERRVLGAPDFSHCEEASVDAERQERLPQPVAEGWLGLR